MDANRIQRRRVDFATTTICASIKQKYQSIKKPKTSLESPIDEAYVKCSNSRETSSKENPLENKF